MGRQWNQIIESLGPLSGGTMSINANLTEIEALLTTLQADVADGISVTTGTLTAGTVSANLRDGSGNAITSTTQGATRRLDVMLSSGGATGSTAPTNANLVGGTDGTNLRGLSVDSSGRLNTNINGTVPVSGTVTTNNQSLTTGSGTLSGTSAVGTDVLSSLDVSGFAELMIQFTGIWPSGGQAQFQISNDNTTFVAHSGYQVGQTTTSNTITTLGMYRISLQGARYIRIRVTTQGSNNSYDYSYTLNPRASTNTTQPVAISSSTALSIAPSTGSGFSNHHTLISAASTNATNVKASGSNIGSMIISNVSSSVRYFKLFNLSVAPTIGTSSPVLNYAIQPNTTLAIDCGFAGIRFSSGLSYAITAGQALLDNTAVGAGDVVVNISYV